MAKTFSVCYQRKKANRKRKAHFATTESTAPRSNFPSISSRVPSQILRPGQPTYINAGNPNSFYTSGLANAFQPVLRSASGLIDAYTAKTYAQTKQILSNLDGGIEAGAYNNAFVHGSFQGSANQQAAANANNPNPAVPAIPVQTNANIQNGNDPQGVPLVAAVNANQFNSQQAAAQLQVQNMMNNGFQNPVFPHQTESSAESNLEPIVEEQVESAQTIPPTTGEQDEYKSPAKQPPASKRKIFTRSQSQSRG